MPIKKLYLELTDKCNLNCKICYRKSWGHGFTDMEEETLQKLVNELKAHPMLEEIVIGGIGEPTMYAAFKETLELLKDYKLTVTTNGTMIDEELSEYLVKYANVVTLSIDGLFEKYKQIRGTDLNKIIHNINILNTLKGKYASKTPLLHIQFVLSSENAEEIFKVMDLSRDLGADKFIVSNIIPQNKQNSTTILYNRYENKEIRDLFSKLIVYSMHRGIKLSLPNYELKTMRSCNFVEASSVFICASGEVSPCYRFSHSYTEFVFGREKTVEKFVFGSLKQDTLFDIWNNRKYEEFRKNILNCQYPSCMDCDWVDGCDFVNSAEADCFLLSPSCGDCLWSRQFVQCP